MMYTKEELVLLDTHIKLSIKEKIGLFGIPPFLLRLEKHGYDYSVFKRDLEKSLIYQKYIDLLESPYEDLPLLINEDKDFTKPIVSWRLSIGK